MGLYKDIGAAWKEAMKNRDPKKDVLSSIRTEVKNKVINTRTDGPTAGGGGEIDAADDLVQDVLRKMAKQRKESVEEYQKGGRQDLVDKESFELSVIESFLPKALDAATLTALVKEAVSESGAAGPKDMGKAMKAAMAKVAGRADGKDVQAAVKAALGA
ncbi:MAG: GatB/YqeY domain-containing protein [Deltaproteobacteria bacterium]|nr:GatB/YqeY domain-containing protein [Deltaproteobacteria bacterium]